MTDLIVKWNPIVSDNYARILGVKKEDVQGPPKNLRYQILGLCDYDIMMSDEETYKSAGQILRELSDIWHSLK